MGSNGPKMEAPASKEEIKEAFSKADSSGDGKLTFQQVKEILATLAPEGENKGPEFDRMSDTNGDGYVTKKELKEFLKMAAGDGDAPPDSEIRMMIAMFDDDDDGKLNYEEF